MSPKIMKWYLSVYSQDITDRSHVTSQMQQQLKVCHLSK
uniref:Uncharacterized protein n=1 Tax=Anguilla anguilla TaxID=7936 RepID=A0A0E9VCD6_ANGAN